MEVIDWLIIANMIGWSHIIHFLYFFYHLGIVIVVPLGQVDPLLHFFESFFKHLCELAGHLLYSPLEIVYFSLFISYFFLLLSFGLIDDVIVFLYLIRVSYLVSHPYGWWWWSIHQVRPGTTSAFVYTDGSSRSWC